MMLADDWEEDELEAVWEGLDAPVPRPASVSLVVVLCLIWALCGLSLGMMLLVASLGAMTMGPPKLAHIFIFIFAWMAISVGILAVGPSLWGGFNWARVALMALLSVFASGGLFLVLVEQFSAGAGWIAVCVLFIVILNSRGVREYCTR